MSIPHIELTDAQHRILAELMLGDLPLPDDEPEAVVARGFSPRQLATDVPVMLWMKLISDAGGVLSATTLGAAIFYRAEQEAAQGRLVTVVLFADALEAAAESERAARLAPHALRQLAQGAISLDEAVNLLS
ncbi:hypothetical protein [Frankia sp. Cr1]|uniref:hypothetical protein n=1 Tax=Frankia sp. Cr1 TaxID=3073931 RepID=UPI002AD41EC7|nr:hypothetical protein [Frankia sp. Cr1]